MHVHLNIGPKDSLQTPNAK